MLLRLRLLAGRIYRTLPIVREMYAMHSVVKQQTDCIRAIANIAMREMSDSYHVRSADPLRLCRHEFQVSSQNGEDGIIDHLFKVIPGNTRYFVEIGCADGTENNTAFLVSQGWNGLWIDASPEAGALIAARRATKRVRFVQDFVTAENVDSLLTAAGAPEDCDLLSLDIDQNTFHVWQAIQSIKPKVVVVEYNSSVPASIDWRCEYQPLRSWDGTINFGASLKAFETLGRQRGYQLVGCDFLGVNAFFVRDEFVQEDLFQSPFTAENHYEPPRFTVFGSRLGHRSTALDIQ